MDRKRETISTIESFREEASCVRRWRIWGGSGSCAQAPLHLNRACLSVQSPTAEYPVSPSLSHSDTCRVRVDGKKQMGKAMWCSCSVAQPPRSATASSACAFFAKTISLALPDAVAKSARERMACAEHEGRHHLGHEALHWSPTCFQ